MSLLLAALLAGLPAHAQSEDALDPLVRRIWDEGVRLEHLGHPEAAAVRYRAVAEAEPTWHRAQLALGRALLAAGDPEGARQVYAELPDDPDALEALGRLLLSGEQFEEAAACFRRLRDLRPEWLGPRVLEAQARATLDPTAAHGLLVDYLAFELITPVEDGLAIAAEAVARALRASGDGATAGGLIQEVLARPGLGPQPALAELLAEIEVDQMARDLASAADAPLTTQQVARLRHARADFAAGRGPEAAEALERLIGEAPLSAATWATLADVREAASDPDGAVSAIHRAARLAPLDAGYQARLGDLLSTHYGGRLDRDAAEAYGRAVRLRLDDPELWYRKAVVERRAGSWALAVASYERVLSLDPDGPRAARAREIVEGARRPLPGPPTAAAESSDAPPADVTAEAWWATHRASAWQKRTEPFAIDRALAELDTALALEPTFTRAMLLQAQIRADRGELDAAILLLERALQLEPDRGDLASQTAALYERVGRHEDARVLHAVAAARGDPSALWRRANSEAAERRWWAARGTLSEYFARTTGGPFYDQALALDRDLTERIQLASAGSAAGGLMVLLIPAAWLLRRRSGAGLDELVARSPEAWRDVARLCSAIRHEVLKHHTSMLSAVADALDDGDPEPARWAAERLFADDGPMTRLDGYLRELEAVGRSAGVRLNLRYRDPIFGPLLAASTRLRVARTALRAGNGRGLAADVRSISEVLDHHVYPALGALIAGLCVLRVDGQLLSEAAARAYGEPAFRGLALPTLVVEDLDRATHVRMFRTDLDDVLVNLIRNALEASIGVSGARLGLSLGVDEDPITGLERLRISVADDAPHRLTTAVLRGRYVARGLGLAVELTGRAGGAVHVEPRAGFRKAIVVSLPLAEVGPIEP